MINSKRPPLSTTTYLIPPNSRRTKDELGPPSIASDATSIAPSEATQVDLRKEIKYGTALQAAWGLFLEFSMNSTVHGIRYFGERKRHWTERVWWLLAFGLSCYGCGRLILNVYIKWDQSPVIVSFAEKSTPVWEIPFPAVTICPETKSYMDMLNFTDVFHTMIAQQTPPYNMSDDTLKRMEAVAQICDAHLTDSFELGENVTTSDMIDVMKEVAINFTDTMFYCKWRNENNFCNAFFKETLTEEGVCYTFNVLNSHEIYKDGISDEFHETSHNISSPKWSLEEGYQNSVPVDPETYPYRIFGSGARSGLFALLRLYEQNLEYLCRGPVQGFKILLHTPGEVPQVSKHYFRVPLLQEVLVSVKPNMITTSDGLRHYEPNRRQCFFNSERSLQYFKVYTQRNCELECLTNFTLGYCGCVKFSMPRDASTPICGARKIKCYNDAEDELLRKDFMAGVENPTRPKGCNCLPACTSITYDAEISQAKFDWISLFNAYKSPLDEFPGMQPARLSIFFKENQFITSRRSELYGPTDFLANCGGLLGLFMGVSLLSIVELIYFCTLRLCCNIRSRKGRKQKNRIAPSEANTIPGIQIDKPNEKKDH